MRNPANLRCLNRSDLQLLSQKNICEKVNQDEVDHYVVKNDIKTFTQLVKEFTNLLGRCIDPEEWQPFRQRGT